MKEQKPVRAPKVNELRLSDLELTSVSAGGSADLFLENGTTIIINLTVPEMCE